MMLSLLFLLLLNSLCYFFCNIDLYWMLFNFFLYFLLYFKSLFNLASFNFNFLFKKILLNYLCLLPLLLSYNNISLLSWLLNLLFRIFLYLRSFFCRWVIIWFFWNCSGSCLTSWLCFGWNFDRTTWFFIWYFCNFFRGNSRAFYVMNLIFMLWLLLLSCHIFIFFFFYKIFTFIHDLFIMNATLICNSIRLSFCSYCCHWSWFNFLWVFTIKTV